MSRHEVALESEEPASSRGRPHEAALALALSLVLAACGGSSSSRVAPPPPPPPPQATLVLGHLTFGESAVDARGIQPGGSSGLHFDGTTLYISDSRNHRVLVFDGIPASDFAPADRVLGQDDLNLEEANAGGISASSLDTPTGVYSDGQRLYLCDSGNHRVLVWDSPPPSNKTPADHVLGQADFTIGLSNRGGAAPARDTLNAPTSISGDGQRLYVGDTDNSRILIWDLPIPFATEGPSADHVLGQADFSSGQTNRGGTAGIGTLNGPNGVFSDGATLLAADTFNHRVLFWSIPPTWTDGQGADGVLGQPDFISTSTNNEDGSLPLCQPEAVAAGRSRRSLNQPMAVFGDGGHTYVAERNNNRVLIWNTGAPGMYSCADVVVGQPGGTTGTANNGGLSATSLRRPQAVFADGTRLLIYDVTNSRVKVHFSIPTADNAPADVVIGQPDFTSGISNHRVIDAASLFFPGGVAASSSLLAVADSGNHRVLIWDPLPALDGQPADIVLGQPDFMTARPNSNPTGLAAPSGLALSPGDSSLFVGDRLSNRVLVYDAPFTAGMAATAALGQPTLSTNVFGTAPNRLYRPSGLSFDGTALWVADEQNNRVVRFSPPFVTNQDADLVLGQPDFTSGAMNGGGSGEQSIDFPTDVFSTGLALLVADRDNHRVLIWNALPQADNEAATAVLGQIDFNVPGLPGMGDSALDSPMGVHHDGQSVMIHDGGNHRVLLWDRIPGPGEMGLPADGVIGQPDLDFNDPNAGGVSPGSLNVGTAATGGVALTPDGLFITDPGNNRVLRF